MSILNDYIDEVGSDTLLVVVNKQWILTALDKYTVPINTTLTDAAESSTLPATTSTAITTLLQTIRDNIKYLFNNHFTKTGTINAIHPVGSIYMSVNNTNPGAYLTGTTWVAWGSGRVPVGVDTNQNEFNSVEKTGGAKTHTLTVDEMPSHSHDVHMYWRDTDMAKGDSRDCFTWYSCSDKSKYAVSDTAGGNGFHNNLQSYITC